MATDRGALETPPHLHHVRIVTPYFLAFLVSWACTWATIKWSAGAGYDHDLEGPQKFHALPVPRIGGLGILLGLSMAAAVLARHTQAGDVSMWMLLACALPTFGIGFLEDLTKRVQPSLRLTVTAAGASIAALELGARITRTDIAPLDWLVAYVWGSYALTIFTVAGVVNAVNIIDGFNGLASMCAMLILLAVAAVAQACGDTSICALALLGMLSVLGFFAWNFPRGEIFLGDGGAYFLGFYIAQLCILLLARNRQVSPLFPLAVCSYPVFETLFSIYRKKFLRGTSPGQPDAVHLHMLVYQRIIRMHVHSRDHSARTRRNSMTAVYLWMLCLLTVGPSVLFWRSTAYLCWSMAAFALLYITLYWRIVRFKIPRWLVVRHR